jgi:hypothetical protein
LLPYDDGPAIVPAKKTLKGFGGADRLDGGAGIDTAFYGDSGAGPDIVTNLTGRKATCSTSPIWMRTRLSPATRISPSSAWRRSRRRARSAGPTNGVDTFIQLNTNADPTVDGIIQVLGVHTVDVSWFSQ